MPAPQPVHGTLAFTQARFLLFAVFCCLRFFAVFGFCSLAN